MNDFSFPKTSRLLNSKHFRIVSKHGRERFGSFLRIQICSSKDNTCRLGLTVSKRFGKAVARNRFKRLVREAYRLSQHTLPKNILLNVRPNQTSKEKLSLDLVKTELSTLLSSYAST